MNGPRGVFAALQQQANEISKTTEGPLTAWDPYKEEHDEEAGRTGASMQLCYLQSNADDTCPVFLL